MKEILLENIVLEDELVRLEPLSEAHFKDLWKIASDKSLWDFTSVKINSEDDFRKYFNEAIEEKSLGKSYPFVVIKKPENRIVGCTRFGNIEPKHRRVEIGWTWYEKAVQGTGLNKHCKFLLLNFAFEKLKYIRVELKTALINTRSQHAIEKIGATKEGILRNHFINDDGSFRDTVYYSILDREWEKIKSTNFKEFQKIYQP